MSGLRSLVRLAMPRMRLAVRPPQQIRVIQNNVGAGRLQRESLFQVPLGRLGLIECHFNASAQTQEFRPIRILQVDLLDQASGHSGFAVRRGRVRGEG